MVNWGEKAGELTNECNLTQKQPPEMIVAAVNAISPYESGNRYPSYVTDQYCRNFSCICR